MSYAVKAYKFEYLNEASLDKFRRASGVNLITKVLTDFILISTSPSNDKIILSNVAMAERYNVTERGVQYVLAQIEELGLAKRIFSDENRHDRVEIELNVSACIDWVTTTRYDQEYQSAQKRSPFRRFVNQTIIFLKDYLEKSLEMYRRKKSEDRVQRLQRKMINYKKHVKYHQKHFNGYMQHVKDVTQDVLDEAILSIAKTMLGYVPPDRPQN
jgi:hypothetical protein